MSDPNLELAVRRGEYMNAIVGVNQIPDAEDRLFFLNKVLLDYIKEGLYEKDGKWYDEG